MKKPFTRRHGQVRALTTQQLNQLTQTDLNKLEDFAERRMGGLPRARVAAEDVVQKALLAIIRGTRKGGGGRRPPGEAVRNKDAFLHYVRSAINSVVEATRRPRELRFIHETIDRPMDPESHERVIVPAALPSPDTDPAMLDLKQELFSRLRKMASARLLPTIAEWEKTFFWATQVPVRKDRHHRDQVRLLAMRVLRQIERDLGG
jgi:DNA-directed RNA polymerase specialized sigma24 family protein